MSLSDYAVTNDRFEVDESGYWCFPCWACKHIDTSPDVMPCKKCGHNAMAPIDKKDHAIENPQT